MAGILTITLNPALDLSTRTGSIRPNVKLRCDPPDVDPAGGGINVSRAIALCGGDSTAFVAVGRASGARLLELLEREGIETIAVDGPGETRLSLAVTETATGDQYRFVLPGPEWTEHDLRRTLDALDLAVKPGAIVVLSGSLPPGLGPDCPARIADKVASKGARLIVDTSGPALLELVARPKGIMALRMNRDEAEGVAGHALPELADSAAFVSGLVARGVAEAVIVARGADGSVLATQSGRWHATPSEPVKVVSAVGAGDSFTGAFALSLSKGADWTESLVGGVATACSAVTTEATRLCDPGKIEMFRQTIVLREV